MRYPAPIDKTSAQMRDSLPEESFETKGNLPAKVDSTPKKSPKVSSAFLTGDKSVKRRISAREIAIFGILGALMYASKAAMSFLPNVHLVGVFIVALTVVYRKKALYPLYTYVFLEGLFGGFTLWWIPYLYIWTILWGAVMLLPKALPKKAEPFIYMAVCSCHGFLFGTLFAPAQAILFGLSFDGMIAWIVAGLPFDAIHGVSNFICGGLIVPIIKAVQRFEGSSI